MLYLEDYLDSKHLNPVPETCVRNPTPDSPRVASRRTLSKLYYDKTCEGKAPIRVLDIIKRVESDSSLFMDKVKDLNGEERNEMLKSIDASLRECLKHGEEKVALAIQAFEMVDRHVKRLDEDIARFEEEQLTGPKLIPTSSSWSNRYALVNDRASRFGTEEGRGKRDRTARVTGEKRTNSSGMLRFELAKGKGLAEDVEVDTPQNKPKRIRSDSDNVSVGTPRKERPPRPVPVPATAKPVRTIPVPPVTTIPSVPPATSSANPKSSTEPLSDPNEPTYCLCNQVSFGEMIACDNQYCEIEWFHYTCVGLDGPPKGKWFCPMCQKGNLKRK